MAAVPIEAQVPRDNPEPRGEARISFRLEFQQASKMIVGESLTDVDVTVSSCIFVGSVGESGVIEHRTV